MWKVFWHNYKRWLIGSAVAIVLVLGLYLIYFALRYPAIRRNHYQASLERIERLLEDRKRFPADVDFEFALETVQKTQEALSQGQLKYQDFARLHYLNQVPLNRGLLGREYNRLFRDLNRLVEARLSGRDELPEMEGTEQTGESPESRLDRVIEDHSVPAE